MSFLELLSWSVWDNLRPRRVLTMVLVSLAGPGFAMLLKLRIPANHYNPQFAYTITVPLAVYSFSMILLCVVFASGIVSSEMVGKTIQYLLTRPVPRWKILLAKWLAAVLLVTLAIMVSCTLTAVVTHGIGGIGNSQLVRDLKVIPLGVVAYCSVFTLLSVLSTKPWLFAIGFGFLWESWVPFLPGDFQKLSIMSQLRALLPAVNNATDAPSRLLDVARAFQPETITSSAALNTLAVITILSLGAACAVFMSAEFVPKDEAV